MTRNLIMGLSLTVAMLAGCSSSRIATRQAIGITIRAMPAYDREHNVEFGGQAVAGQLKLLEGLLESAPDDPDLLLALARSYSRYAYGHVQLKIDCARYTGNEREQALWTVQARDFYARAKGYGLRFLERTNPHFANALAADRSILSAELKTLHKNKASALFWTAFAWGNELAQQIVTPEILVGLSSAALLMQRVVELDERVASGSAHLFLGTYYGRLPPMLGGDRDRADEHFRRAREAGNDHYLPARLAQAEHQWHVTGDKKAYFRELNDITAAADHSVPEHNLDNAVARRKASIRLAAMDSSLACDCSGQGYGILP